MAVCSRKYNYFFSNERNPLHQNKEFLPVPVPKKTRLKRLPDNRRSLSRPNQKNEKSTKFSFSSLFCIGWKA